MTPNTRLVPKLSFRLALPKPSSAVAVRLAFLASAVLLLVFVATQATRVPIHDEYSSVIFLYADPPLPLSMYWAQHNEHRIPLPRLLYVAAVRLAGDDFRAPPLLNAALLIAAAAFLLVAVRRLRGEPALADLAIPLGLLTVGQYGNLLWGFQVQFVASVALVVVALGLAVDPRLLASKRRLSGLGLCGLLLPLCGANGVAFAPGIALGLLFAAYRAENRSLRFVALGWGSAILSLTAAYFDGLETPPHHREAHGELTAAAIGFVNLLGASFGPVARWLQPAPYEGITVLGVVALGLVAATGGLLVRAALDPARRTRAVVLGGVLVGFLGLAAGIAKGRAGLSNVLDANRYVTLMLPMLSGVYLAWTAFGPARLPRMVAVAVAVAAVPNLVVGWREARSYTYFARQIEYEVKSGMPLEFVADRNVGLYRGEPGHRRDFLALLRRKGVDPFRIASPLPRLDEEPVPVRVVRFGDAVEDAGGFRVTADTGYAVFALPRRQPVYGLRLTYEAGAGENQALPNVLSWEPGGRPPSSAAGGVLNQLEPMPRPSETLVYLRTEAETLRIDLFGRGARVVVHRLVVLTPAD